MTPDRPMASFDPTKVPADVRAAALAAWNSQYARQATVCYGKRGPSPFMAFMQGWCAHAESYRLSTASEMDETDARRQADADAGASRQLRQETEDL